MVPPRRVPVRAEPHRREQTFSQRKLLSAAIVSVAGHAGVFGVAPPARARRGGCDG